MIILASEQFSQKFLAWCIEKMHEEINHEFSTLKQMNNPYTLLEVYALQTLSQQKQEEALMTQIQRQFTHLTFGQTLINRLAEGELSPLGKVINTVRYSDSAAKKLFAEETLNQYQDYSTSFLSKVAHAELSSRFAHVSKKAKGNLEFCIEVSDWQVITRVDICKGSYTYSHQIDGHFRNQKVRLADYTIFFPRYIGLIMGETWCFHTQEDVENAAKKISELCNVFLDFLLENIPKLSECKIAK
jgi:uncharacterized phage-associated protein